MTTIYAHSLDQCDVADRKSLEAFREKRAQWLVLLETDEHHAIWGVLSGLVWHDISFRTIARLAETNPESGLHNPLLIDALITGHFAHQSLAIRRLMDRRKDVASLPRLINEIRRHVSLFTRENFVAFDGLPYNYEAAEERLLKRELSGPGPHIFWQARRGPDAYGTAQRAHEQFDRLTGVEPRRRSRQDRLPKWVLDTLEVWLAASGADELAKWTNNLLAHAAGPSVPERASIAAAGPTVDKISKSIRSLVRVADAITAQILFHSGRGMLSPVPQFNQFEKLEMPLMPSDGRAALAVHWDELANERDGYLAGIEADLLASTPLQRSRSSQ
jgi:hypothetical protein